jgi:hypothetical protein
MDAGVPPSAWSCTAEARVVEPKQHFFTALRSGVVRQTALVHEQASAVWPRSVNRVHALVALRANLRTRLLAKGVFHDKIRLLDGRARQTILHNNSLDRTKVPLNVHRRPHEYVRPANPCVDCRPCGIHALLKVTGRFALFLRPGRSHHQCSCDPSGR